VDARKLQNLQSAPQVSYSNREPPLEIRHLPGLKNGEDWGYVTFGELTLRRFRSLVYIRSESARLSELP
jgi:hypothetical protein